MILNIKKTFLIVFFFFCEWTRLKYFIGNTQNSELNNNNSNNLIMIIIKTNIINVSRTFHSYRENESKL